MINFWSDFWYGIWQLAGNAAIVGGTVLLVILCYWALESSQKFWTSSPPAWFNDWFDTWFYGRKK